MDEDSTPKSDPVIHGRRSRPEEGGECPGAGASGSVPHEYQTKAPNCIQLPFVAHDQLPVAVSLFFSDLPCLRVETVELLGWFEEIQ